MVGSDSRPVMGSLLPPVKVVHRVAHPPSLGATRWRDDGTAGEWRPDAVRCGMDARPCSGPRHPHRSSSPGTAARSASAMTVLMTARGTQMGRALAMAGEDADADAVLAALLSAAEGGILTGQSLGHLREAER